MPSINIPVTEEQLTELKKFKQKGETWTQFILSGLWFKGCVIRTPYVEFGEHWEIDPSFVIEKPCHKTGFCPYGQMVEAFSITPERTELSCSVFGHNCPVFYASEPLSE